MKFLLFNMAVAAALVFLFTANRGEVQDIAGQVHDAAGDMKDYARQALDSRRDVFDRADRLGREALRPSREYRPRPPAYAAEPATRDPVGTPVAGDGAGVDQDRDSQPNPMPSAPEPLPSQLAKNLPPMPEIGEDASGTDLAGLDPDVAQRRREVLDGIGAADAVADGTPALKEGTRLMTPSERRRELLSLAEEMELLYARSISQ